MHYYLKNKNNPKTLIQLIYYCKSEKANFKMSTGQSIDPADWDFTARMPLPKRGRDDLRAIRVVLDRITEKLETRLNELKINGVEPTRENLREAFTDVSKGYKRVSQLFDTFIGEKSATGSKSLKYKYSNVRDKLKEFHPTLTIDAVNDSIVARYSGWLVDNYDYTDNTLARHIIFLRTFLKWAKKNGYFSGNITYRVSKYQADDIALNEAEILLLEQKEFTGKLKKVRDIALVGIYSGQRFSDYSIFDRADIVGDMLIKRAKKTGQESYIPLHPKLKAILDSYDWRLPTISNQKFNDYFKVVCEKAGINRPFKKTEKRGGKKKTTVYKAWEVVSSHTCRRTYITLASQKGIPDEVIMKVTGIRDIKTLYNYKKITLDSVMDATKGLF